MKAKNQLKKLSVWVLIIAMMSMSGCTKNNDEGIIEKPVEESTVPEIEEPAKIYKVQVDTFDLGPRTYIAQGGKELPYQLGGIMAVPEGEGKFPLILVTHGSHESENKENRFDTGFEYLVTALAEKGYVAISLDVRNAYIWEYGDGNDNEKIRVMTHEHLQALKAANEGLEKGYPINLQDKIDFENVGLIGHSRGGKTVFDIANDQRREGVKVRSILAIAPTFDDVQGDDWPDVDTAILIPEYDGDVNDLAGFEIYNRMKMEEHTGFVSLTLLEKANHNYFNSNIELNDTMQLGEGYEDQLTREDQELFLRQFAIEFLDASIKDKVQNTLYDVNRPSPKELYGYSVKTSLDTPSEVPLIDLTQYETLKEAWFYKYDEIQGFNTPILGNPEEGVKDLISITWNELGTKQVFIPVQKDFSNQKSLRIEIAQDPSHEFAIVGQTQGFTLQLIDAKGNSASVDVVDEAALRYVKGELEFTEIEGKNYYFWSNFTPLTDMHIPLKQFEGIDLSNIEKIVFVFDKTPSGAVLIESMSLLK